MEPELSMSNLREISVVTREESDCCGVFDMNIPSSLSWLFHTIPCFNSFFLLFYSVNSSTVLF